MRKKKKIFANFFFLMDESDIILRNWRYPPAHLNSVYAGTFHANYYNIGIIGHSGAGISMLVNNVRIDCFLFS